MLRTDAIFRGDDLELHMVCYQICLKALAAIQIRSAACVPKGRRAFAGEKNGAGNR